MGFNITSGPHVGQNGTDTTDDDGNASFTYTGNNVGTDDIRVKTIQGIPVYSLPAIKTWTPQQNEIPEFPTIALPIIVVLGLAFFFQRRND
ncbi:PEF-CTERM sorting domain-containing protein [Methanococcoides sp. SA1]|nr:PEF-CTERM sorting domain-containing protein [Methanococcoides sp. SA1]